MKGKVCVITGTTTGVGSVIAGALAKRKATVIMLNKNASSADRQLRDLEVYAVSTTIHAVPFNPESWLSVSQAADEILSDHGRVNLIINNGQAFFPGARQTTGVVNMATRVNLLAHAQLTMRLLDRVRASKGRVLTLTGPLQSVSPIVPTDSGTSPEGYRAFLLSQARLLVFSLELARRLGNDASAIAVNPGPVNTDSTRGLPLMARLGRAFRDQMPSVAAQVAIDLASTESGRSGELFGSKGPVAVPSALAKAELGPALWDWCEQELDREHRQAETAVPTAKAK